MIFARFGEELRDVTYYTIYVRTLLQQGGGATICFVKDIKTRSSSCNRAHRVSFCGGFMLVLVCIVIKGVT